MVKGENEFADPCYQVGKVGSWGSEDVSTASLALMGSQNLKLPLNLTICIYVSYLSFEMQK